MEEQRAREKLTDWNVGRNLKTARTRRRMTPEWVAQGVGTISAQDVLDYEAGKKRPGAGILIELARVLGVPFADLIIKGSRLGEVANDDRKPLDT